MGRPTAFRRVINGTARVGVTGAAHAGRAFGRAIDLIGDGFAKALSSDVAFEGGVLLVVGLIGLLAGLQVAGDRGP